MSYILYQRLQAPHVHLSHNITLRKCQKNQRLTSRLNNVSPSKIYCLFVCLFVCLCVCLFVFLFFVCFLIILGYPQENFLNVWQRLDLIWLRLKTCVCLFVCLLTCLFLYFNYLGIPKSRFPESFINIRLDLAGILLI